MPDTADVVVIGGGVIGTSIALALTQAGVKHVTLLEKSALASGASGRSSALVRMHYTNVEDARLAWASYPLFRDWPERIGGPSVFRRTGFVAVVGPEDAAALRANVAMLRGIGVDTVALTAAELASLQPFLAVDDIGAAAYEPHSGYASPADVVEGFRRQAVARGAEIHPSMAAGDPHPHARQRRDRRRHARGTHRRRRHRRRGRRVGAAALPRDRALASGTAEGDRHDAGEAPGRHGEPAHGRDRPRARHVLPSGKRRAHPRRRTVPGMGRRSRYDADRATAHRSR